METSEIINRNDWVELEKSQKINVLHMIVYSNPTKPWLVASFNCLTNNLSTEWPIGSVRLGNSKKFIEESSNWIDHYFSLNPLVARELLIGAYDLLLYSVVKCNRVIFCLQLLFCHIRSYLVILIFEFARNSINFPRFRGNLFETP